MQCNGTVVLFSIAAKGYDQWYGTGIFPEIESELFYGGPVGTDTPHYIHNVGDLLDESVQVMRGVYWGGNFDKLKFLIQQQLILPENIRFFIGYSDGPKGTTGRNEYRSWIASEGAPIMFF